MTDTPELLPCPFCGGAAEVREWDFPYVRFQARCVECKTTGRTRFNERAKAIAAWNHRTPPTPATDAREVVARALCEARIRTVRRHDTKPEDLEAMLPASIDYSWRDFVAEADAALSALAPIRAAEILAAEANERARIVAWLDETAWLLERDYFGQLRYFSAACQDEAPTDWTPDNLQALRFARRIDAERFASREATDCIDIRVVEHMWCAIEHGAGK